MRRTFGTKQSAPYFQLVNRFYNCVHLPSSDADAAAPCLEPLFTCCWHFPKSTCRFPFLILRIITVQGSIWRLGKRMGSEQSPCAAASWVFSQLLSCYLPLMCPGRGVLQLVFFAVLELLPLLCCNRCMLSRCVVCHYRVFKLGPYTSACWWRAKHQKKSYLDYILEQSFSSWRFLGLHVAFYGQHPQVERNALWLRLQVCLASNILLLFLHLDGQPV